MHPCIHSHLSISTRMRGNAKSATGVCTNMEIEDETNMLFNCSLYDTLREHFLVKQQHIFDTTFERYMMIC